MPILNFLLQTATVTDTLATAASTADTTEVGITENISYIEFLMKGGVMIVPIILLLFFCIYIIFERYMSITKLTKQDPHLLKDIRQQLQNGKVDNAMILCTREHTSTGVVLGSGLSRIGRPISEIEAIMDKTATIEIVKMEKNLGYLGLISGIAPILGFVGTILGVIKIFHTISVTGNLNIQTISGGLYEKMISSGAGLIVGVIGYSAYHVFNMMIDRYLARVQEQTLEIINIIQEPDGN